jgi:hypothetical protein
MKTVKHARRRPPARPKGKQAAPKKAAAKKAAAPGRARRYQDLDIGPERVSSNECWTPEEEMPAPARVYGDLRLGDERVTSNECYDVEEG